MLNQASLLTRPTLADISPSRPESAKPASLPQDAPTPSEAAAVFAHLQKGSMAAPFYAGSGHGLFSLLYCDVRR